MRITMFDRLRQGERFWNDQPRTPPFARQHRLSIGTQQEAPVAPPAITEPAERALVGACDRAGHGSLDQVLAQRTSGAGGNVATVPVLDQASPAFSLVRLVSFPLFFCTNDQNSSISTWVRCRSLASTCVKASAWAAALLTPRADRLVFVA